MFRKEVRVEAEVFSTANASLVTPQLLYRSYIYVYFFVRIEMQTCGFEVILSIVSASQRTNGY